MTCIKNNTNNKLSLENWRVDFGIDWLRVQFDPENARKETFQMIAVFDSCCSLYAKAFLNVVTTYTYKSTCKDVCDISNNFLVAYARTVLYTFTHIEYPHILTPSGQWYRKNETGYLWRWVVLPFTQKLLLPQTWTLD